jgi:hypothetical protein
MSGSRACWVPPPPRHYHATGCSWRTERRPNVTTDSLVDRPRLLAAGMRWLLVGAGVLVFLAGISLYLFPLSTADWFAWTVNPPMSAAFLGGSYFAAAGIEWMAATRRFWADARIAVPGVFLFTVLTLIVTLVHLDKFHLGADLALRPRMITWAWLAIYALVPVLLAIVWLKQSRQPGSDPPRTAPLTPLIRVTVAVQTVVLVIVGAGLLVAPLTLAALWPWELTPLTGRAIGAWLVSLAVVAAEALYENDMQRIRPAGAGALAFAVLQTLALVRYWSDLHSTAATVGFIVVLLTFFITGSTVFRRGTGESAPPASSRAS